MLFQYLKRVIIGPDKEIRILQWNCNGVRRKHAVLKNFLEKQKIDIALIQETHLNPYHKFDLGPNYVIYRKDRPTHKGGVMSIFSKNLSRVYKMHIKTPPGVEGQSWFLIHHGFQKLMIHNWYCAPMNVKNKRLRKTVTLKPILPYMRKNGILVGDFNCKCHWWGYKDSDSLGRDIQRLVNNDNVSFLNNKDTATLLKVRRMLKQG